MQHAGYGPDQIDATTLLRYRRFCEGWKSEPPLWFLVAGAVGFKPRPVATQSAPALATPSGVASIPGMIVRRGKRPAKPKSD